MKMVTKDLQWARHAIDSMLCGCLLNIKLRHMGLCNKYLFEMTDREVLDYVKLLSELK